MAVGGKNENKEKGGKEEKRGEKGKREKVVYLAFYLFCALNPHVSNAEALSQKDLKQSKFLLSEEKLNFLKKNIYKSLPNTRLESKTDSLAYNR